MLRTNAWKRWTPSLPTRTWSTTQTEVDRSPGPTKGGACLVGWRIDLGTPRLADLYRISPRHDGSFFCLFAVSTSHADPSTVPHDEESSSSAKETDDCGTSERLTDPPMTWISSTEEGTWMSVDVHDNLIVFDLLGDIWTIPLSGGQATQLTSGPAWDSEPRFSPDGAQIAFVSDGDGNEQLWIMNSDGTEAKAFTQEPTARVTDPVWDPNGSWLIGRRRTVDTRSIGVTELWQYHLDGGAGFALTSKECASPCRGVHNQWDSHLVLFSQRSL